MELSYDPGKGERFWEAISQLPGYPQDEVMPIPTMFFASGAVFRLPEVLHQIAGAAAPVLVVMDPTVMKRGAEELKPLILSILGGAGRAVETLVLEPDSSGQVHTDMPHIQAVRQRLRPGLAVFSVGSGVVTDVAKHAAFLYQQGGGEKLPLVVFQTANSVSAFTSNMAPVFVGGVKRTLPSRYPDALVCDLETLRDAPMDMTVAGVGDLLAFYVSIPDWFLANQLGIDPSYTLLPQRLLGPMDEIFMEQAGGIRAGALESVAILAKLIALGGLIMSLSHATTPASGFEHVMSHILDMQAEVAGLPLAMHGTQVALNTVIGTDVYQRFLAGFDPARLDLETCYPAAEEMKARVFQAFQDIDPSGKTAEECWSDYRIKLEAWHAHKDQLHAFLTDWPALREQMASLTCPPERINQILKAVGSPRRFAQLTPPIIEEQVKQAFLNASLMRKRLTIGDLLIFFQWDREALWRQVWEHSQALGS